MRSTDKPDAPFGVDPDISKAWTIGSEFYTEHSYFEKSKNTLFARSWQIVTPSDESSADGNIVPASFLPGAMDTPLVVTRDQENRTTVFSNVCTHRGAILVERPCTGSSIRCPYHGRRFGLDGRFQFMPGFEGVADFPSASDHLPRLENHRFGPWLFASPDPAISFEAFIEPVVRRIPWFPWSECRYVPERSPTYSLSAHWATYCENYLEGFHIPFVHKGLNSVLDYGSYKTETESWCITQIGTARPGELSFERSETSGEADGEIAAFYFFLFPNIMINVYPWGISLNIVQPHSPTHTEVQYRTYVLDETKFGQGAGADLGTVEREDQKVVESVALGLKSRYYRRGRFSVVHERGTHHFQRLISECFDFNNKNYIE